LNTGFPPIAEIQTKTLPAYRVARLLGVVRLTFSWFARSESLRNLCGISSNRLAIRCNLSSSLSVVWIVFMNQRAPFESPLEPFESPKELLNGAKERLAELEPMCNAISEMRDYEIITHTDPKTREKVVKVRLKQRFPPKVRRLASTILKELRLALDQAFCEGAVALGRRDAKGIQFPFEKDPGDLKRAVGRRCAGVDKRLIDYCLSFKPHYGGDSDGFCGR
jgi:hypothetical protein